MYGRTINFSATAIALMLVMPLWSYAAHLDLVSADWSAKARHNLVSMPPTEKDVDKFLDAVGVGINGPGQYGMTGFRFADLRGTGQLSLIVSSGRFGNFTSIIDKVPSGFEWTELPEAFGGATAENIGGGKSAVVLGRDLTYYQGAMHCVAVWPVIYAWTGGGYADVSEKSKAYYRRDLEWLRKEIAAGKSKNVDDIDCLEAQQAKIERFLGDKTAGLADALRWSRSKDEYTRKFAGPILADIGTAEAMRRLKQIDLFDYAYKLDGIHTPEAKKELEAIAKEYPGEYSNGGRARVFLQLWDNGPSGPDLPETTLIPFSELSAPSAKPTVAK